MLGRRSFLLGLIAAPAVIRVAPLMRITPVPLVTPWEIEYLECQKYYQDGVLRVSIPAGAWRRVRVTPEERLVSFGAYPLGNLQMRAEAELPSSP